MRSLLLAAGVLVFVSPLSADDATAQLQGVWQAVSIEADGKTIEPPAGSSLVVRGDGWIERKATGDTMMTFKVDAKRDPKQIDAVAGSLVVRGIYKIEGDVLTVSLPLPVNGQVSSKRATTFSTKPKDPFMVLVYKRDPTAAIPPLPQWSTDWSAAFAKARTESQLVLVDYFADWCKPCHYMDDTVLKLPDVTEKLNDFVLLRADFDKGGVAAKHSVDAIPSYIIYDPSERERFRITGIRTPADFRRSLDAARSNTGDILKVSDLLDRNRTVDGQLVLGNVYSRMNMIDEARAAYKEAKSVAGKTGDNASAQMADALFAFTYAREGNPKRAIKMLEKLAAAPVDKDTESLIWLTIGNAQRLQNDSAAAHAAYQHALSAASPGSASEKRATEALAAMNN